MTKTKVIIHDDVAEKSDDRSYSEILDRLSRGGSMWSEKCRRCEHSRTCALTGELKCDEWGFQLAKKGNSIGMGLHLIDLSCDRIAECNPNNECGHFKEVQKDGGL